MNSADHLHYAHDRPSRASILLFKAFLRDNPVAVSAGLLCLTMIWLGGTWKTYLDAYEPSQKPEWLQETLDEDLQLTTARACPGARLG